METPQALVLGSYFFLLVYAKRSVCVCACARARVRARVRVFVCNRVHVIVCM